MNHRYISSPCMFSGFLQQTHSGHLMTVRPEHMWHMPQLQMTEVAGRVEPSRCVVTSCAGGYSEHHDSGGLSLVVLTVAAGGLGPASSQDTGEMYLWLLYPVSVVLDSVCGLGNSRRIEGDNSIARIHCHLERPMSPV